MRGTDLFGYSIKMVSVGNMHWPNMPRCYYGPGALEHLHVWSNVCHTVHSLSMRFTRHISEGFITAHRALWV